MILACKSIQIAFGTETILSDCSFHIEEQQKTALVGNNGAGKTTLLKLIAGELEADGGEIIFSKEASLGYLAQHQDLDASGSIYDYLLETKKEVIELEQKLRDTELKMKQSSGDALNALYQDYEKYTHRFELLNGYAYRSEVIGVLKGLGFSENEFHKDISLLSGGQKTRVSLGRLLLTKPDLILLDEPTNHLDMESIRWLETFLSNYRGAVLVVSHDRYFLDRIVTKVIEIEHGTASSFEGNYTVYRDKKEKQRAEKLKAYLNWQQDVRHQQQVIEKLRSFNREKSIKRAESREKLLNQKLADEVEKPAEEMAAMRLTLEPETVSGKDVLTVRELSKSFGPKHLFSHLSFEIRRGEKIALIGNNGTGKTTILKMIRGMIPADAGEILTGAKVEIGYFDQEHRTLSMGKTVFDEISDTWPDMDQTRIRNVLAAFLFTGDDVFKKIGDLSGGERGRLALAKLMLSEANFLILDEPTNHLDIQSKEILASALNSYTGTLLYVSHDRYFINQTATRILDLADGALTSYPGNYDYYLEKKESIRGGVPSSSRPDAGQSGNVPGSDIPNSADTPDSGRGSGAGKTDWIQKKEEQARMRRRKNDFLKTEQAIMELEERNEELDSLFTEESVYTDAPRLMTLQKEKNENEEKLAKLYELWESFSDLQQ